MINFVSLQKRWTLFEGSRFGDPWSRALTCMLFYVTDLCKKKIKSEILATNIK